MRRILLSLCLLLSTIFLFGQGIRVTGRVTDDVGETLPGVTIMVKGTTTGTVTDLDGRYELLAPAPDVILVYSFIGMASQEVPLQGRSIVDVVLGRAVTDLDEVVVVGYGTQRRESMVAAISTISSKEIVQSPTSNLVLVWLAGCLV
jgi:TonB-dependent starch-binding outer membrane protein SusC